MDYLDLQEKRLVLIGSYEVEPGTQLVFKKPAGNGRIPAEIFYEEHINGMPTEYRGWAPVVSPGDGLDPLEYTMKSALEFYRGWFVHNEPRGEEVFSRQTALKELKFL